MATTTSTSSTSISSTSTSSTSTSMSSTSSSSSTSSTSISASSISTSSTSSSISTSSTSSSISSTSSSTSSTSTSSTSSSTSISSTSSSISSTSVSSTSTSSTSSSTSISSTSTSFSSTSSSISSTSASTSSTSFSSTSSSSSTSTTTLPPPYISYSYVDSLELPSPISLVQTTSGSNAAGATATTSTSAFTSPITAGNAILVGIANDGAAGSVTSVTDTLKNTYIRLTSAGTTVTSEIWAAFNVIAGASNIVTANQGFNDGTIHAQEWSGLQPVGTVDKLATGSGSISANGNITTRASDALAQADELLFVAGEIDVVAGTAIAAGSGFSNFNTITSNVVNGAIESRVVSSVNSAQGAFSITATGSSAWRMSLVSLKGQNLSSLNSTQYSNELVDDGDYFVQYGSEYMIQIYKRTNTNNTDTPTFTWKGRTTYDTRISPIVMQIYNVNSATWETFMTDNTIPADTDFACSYTQKTNVSNYYSSNNTVTFRTYQQVI